MLCRDLAKQSKTNKKKKHLRLHFIEIPFDHSSMHFEPQIANHTAHKGEVPLF